MATRVLRNDDENDSRLLRHRASSPGRRCPGCSGTRQPATVPFRSAEHAKPGFGARGGAAGERLQLEPDRHRVKWSPSAQHSRARERPRRSPQRPAHHEALVRLEAVRGEAVLVGVDAHGLAAKLSRAAHDTQGDLAAVGGHLRRKARAGVGTSEVGREGGRLAPGARAGGAVLLGRGSAASRSGCSESLLLERPACNPLQAAAAGAAATA